MKTAHHIVLWTDAPGARPWWGWYDGEDPEDAASVAVEHATLHPDGYPVFAEPCEGCLECQSDEPPIDWRQQRAWR